ncbi:NTP transferase domain-containing protein [Paenibacillus albidus]|nr:NTP transferase domain-containing protein [Paenibacillus albidus]
MKVAGIYLAAGHNRRTGISKAARQQLQEFPGSRASLRELECCILEPLVVVVRANDTLEWLPPAVNKQGARRTETCLTAHLGLSFSLRCGLNAVLPLQPDAVIVAQADQPGVTSLHVNRLINTFRQSPELDYVADAGCGLLMPPALFSKAMFNALQGLNEDEGMAGLLRSPDYKGVVLEAEAEV